MYSKFKDSDPLDTANKFYEVLTSIGLDLNIELHKMADDVHSCSINAKNIGFSSYGKGTTEVYSLASGLGEMIERIQSGTFENFSKANKDFVADGVLLDIVEFFDDNPSVLKHLKKSYLADSEKDDASIEELCHSLKHINENLIEGDKFRCVPFYSTKHKGLRHLPFSLIRRLCGSNGNSAGNTPEESLVQAMSELLERYVFSRIITKKLTPPIVDNDWLEQNSKENYTRLECLKRITGFEFSVHDCSLGRGFPCLCLLATDKKTKKYSVFCGSHPIFDIALERCITEMFQTISSERLHIVMDRGHSIFDEEAFNEVLSKNNILNHNHIKLPNQFFSRNSSWEFKDWQQKAEEFDNVKGAKYLTSLIERESGESLFIRNLSFLGIPTFFVYSPKLSILNSISKKTVDSLLFFRKLRGYKNEKLSEEEKRDLIKSLKESSFELGYSYDVNMLLCSLYFDLKEYKDSKKFLKHSKDKLKECIRKEIELIEENISLEDRDVYLSKFFNLEDIEHLNKIWRNGEVFSKMLLKNNKAKSKLNIKPFIEKRNELIKSNVLDQLEIKYLFE